MVSLNALAGTVRTTSHSMLSVWAFIEVTEVITRCFDQLSELLGSCTCRQVLTHTI